MAKDDKAPKAEETKAPEQPKIEEPKAEEAKVPEHNPGEGIDPAAPELPSAVPDRGPPIAPATAWGNEKTVNMFFPKRVTLTRDDHVLVQFTPGVHPVGEKYADHWYLKAHGVKRA